MQKPRRTGLKRVAWVLAALVIAWLGLSRFYQLPPGVFAMQAARVVLTPVAGLVYRSDLRQTEATIDGYSVGARPPAGETSRASWTSLAARTPGLALTNPDDIVELQARVPFVYETSSAQFLERFRQTYHVDDVVQGAPTEYDAMLKLGHWVGTQFDHGTDTVPGGDQVCDPTTVVATGRSGSRYWCEIAARLMVHAANSLGWQARIITGSRDGYTWEHAVAELWSNQFGKWFAIDTDFNVLYEVDGVPLSAFELSARGEQLQRDHRLTIREIAPRKASLPRKDVIPYYSYVHVDLRSDWCTRHLRAGSPAGGDLATWWVARPSLPHVLTAKTRVDDETKFDWHVNTVTLYALDARRLDDGSLQVTAGLSGYTPSFDHFEVSLDGGDWQRLAGSRYEARLAAGDHVLGARIVTRAGQFGPASRVGLRLAAGNGG